MKPKLHPWSPGMKVEKVSGYKFPGVVLAPFYTLSGKLRYAVEAEGEGFEGMIHIFSPEQLTERKP